MKTDEEFKKDLDDFDEMIRKIDLEKENWSKWDTIKFEISYFFSNIQTNYYSFLKGVSNLWRWREIIWNDRWYDHSFLHTMLKFKLTDMRDNWKDAHYVGAEYEEKDLKEIVELFEKIDYLEENWDKDTYSQIDNLYQEIGIKLFSITTKTKVDSEFDNGINVSTCSNIQRFWD